MTEDSPLRASLEAIEDAAGRLGPAPEFSDIPGSSAIASLTSRNERLRCSSGTSSVLP